VPNIKLVDVGTLRRCADDIFAENRVHNWRWKNSAVEENDMGDDSQGQLSSTR
jgi:hypothetical protein